jgi:Fe-S-cluster containining protein
VTGQTTTQLIREKTIRIEPVPFDKAFGFGPVADMLDMFELSRRDTVPVAFLGFRTDRTEKRVCKFLSAPKEEKRLCTIYEHRPAMCRLHPLGCVTINGRRKWIYRRPLCDTEGTPEQTLREWLRESRIQPFLAANTKFLHWMQELLEACGCLSTLTESEKEKLGKILYDFDSIQPDGIIITMKIINEMFYEWLASIKPRKKGGS